MTAANSVGQRAKSVVVQAAAAASKQAGEVVEDVTGDIKEQIGLAGPAPTQAPQDSQAAAQPNVNQIQADDNRRTRNRMQALQTELAQISGKVSQEQNRLRPIRDPQAAQPVEENVVPVPSSKQGRQMRGAPGQNRAMAKAQELGKAEIRQAPSQ